MKRSRDSKSFKNGKSASSAKVVDGRRRRGTLTATEEILGAPAQALEKMQEVSACKILLDRAHKRRRFIRFRLLEIQTKRWTRRSGQRTQLAMRMRGEWIQVRVFTCGLEFLTTLSVIGGSWRRGRRRAACHPY